MKRMSASLHYGPLCGSSYRGIALTYFYLEMTRDRSYLPELTDVLIHNTTLRELAVFVVRTPFQPHERKDEIHFLKALANHPCLRRFSIYDDLLSVTNKRINEELKNN